MLQEAIELLLHDVGARVWRFGRDQAPDEKSIGASLRERIRGCAAVVVLLSPFTLESGATQWMELAYADAFGIPTFVLLHHLTVDQLRRAEKGVPPLVLERNCTLAIDWRLLENGLRRCCEDDARERSAGTKGLK